MHNFFLKLRYIDFKNNYLVDADFFFHKENVFERLALVRISLGIICLIFNIEMYDDFYIKSSDFLHVPGIHFLTLPILGNIFSLLKWLNIFLSVAMILGFKTRFTSIFLAITFFIFNLYVSHFGPNWNYNTHLNFFVIALCFVDSSQHFSIDSLQNATRLLAQQKWSNNFRLLSLPSCKFLSFLFISRQGFQNSYTGRLIGFLAGRLSI
jgi:uncharacterized membrane protein YphA (DoxX/SURF4 family)